MSADNLEPTVTLRMPLANWRGIVNGIEKWAGDGAGSHEILQDVDAGDSSCRLGASLDPDHPDFQEQWR